MKVTELAQYINNLRHEVEKMEIKLRHVSNQVKYANSNATIAIWGGGSDEGPEKAVIVSHNGFDWETPFREYAKYLASEIKKREEEIARLEDLSFDIPTDIKVMDIWKPLTDLSECVNKMRN